MEVVLARKYRISGRKQGVLDRNNDGFKKEMGGSNRK